MSAIEEIRQFWDDDAAVYDRAPGHHPRSGPLLAAWTAVLANLLPHQGAAVLDCGAGTGFLSLIAARLGHRVTALDLSGDMLARLRSHAAAEGLADDIDVIQGPATAPPPGPFDVVMERHLVWTLPDPGEALAAWRSVGRRLVLFESLWGEVDPLERWRGRLRKQLDRWQHRPSDHHGEYPAQLRASLPLGTGTAPEQLIALVEQAGWTAPQLVRLRDVEWAARLPLSPLDRAVGTTPRFAICAGGGAW